MLKSWIVFPAGMQPTIAQAKEWNAHMHELRGVHWGTQRKCPNVLAVEVDAESLQTCMQHSDAFDGLVKAWLRRGVEIRAAFDFLPDRDALNPERKAKHESQVTIRILPGPVRFWEPKSRPCVALTEGAAPVPFHVHPPRQFRTGKKNASRVGQLLFAGALAAGTIAAGVKVVSELKQSGMEKRRDTIERIDDSTRKDPRRGVVLNTRFEGQGKSKTMSQAQDR